MRVAARRLHAALQLFAPWIDRGEVRRLRRDLRRVTRTLGTVRELDLARERLDELAANNAAEHTVAIEFVISRVDGRLRRARVKMRADLERIDMDRLDARLRRLGEKLAFAGVRFATDTLFDGGRTAAEMRVVADALGRVGFAVEKLREFLELLPVGSMSERRVPSLRLVSLNERADRLQGKSLASRLSTAKGHTPIGDDDRVPPSAPVEFLLSTVAAAVLRRTRGVLGLPVLAETGTVESTEALHRVRVAGKKVRYMIEILAPHMPNSGRPLVERLSCLQDRLGLFHDDAVLDAMFHGEIGRLEARGQVLLASQLKSCRCRLGDEMARRESAARSAIAALADDDCAEQVRVAMLDAGVPAEMLPRAATKP
jgi:CHAD domain-containing protein